MNKPVKTNFRIAIKPRQISTIIIVSMLAVAFGMLLISITPVRADVTLTDCPGTPTGDFSFAKQSSDYVVSSPSAASSMTWSLTTPNKSSSGGIPGVIEFCVYPDNMGQVTGQSTGAVGANGASWSAGLNCKSGSTNTCVKSERPDGDPSNIPDNGATTPNVLSITFSAAPSSWTIVLHVNDPAECAALFGAGTLTCFVFPSTGQQQFPPAALTVTKTATPSFARKFTWGIAKAVDNTEINTSAGTKVTFNYKVDVTHNTGTDGAFQITGTITVTNPNTQPVTGVTVTDSTLGGTCAVGTGSGGQDPVLGGTIPLSSSVDYPYTCTFLSNPGSGTNTASASWPSQTLGAPYTSDLAAGIASGTASYDFSGVTPTIVDGSVTVTDTLGGFLGTVSYTDPSPTSFTYSNLVTAPSGTCATYDNTATFTTDTTGTTGSASQTVKVCGGADLTVSKTATASFTRTFAWSIAKSVDQTRINIASGGTATFTYTVSVMHDSGTDSNWQVNGIITVTNPNDWESITANVVDAVDNGGTCAVSGGTNVVVAASSSVNLPYTCTYASAPSPSSGTNTATATWNGATYFTPDSSATGTATFDFSTVNPTIVDGSVTVTDTLGGFLGTVSYTDPSPTTFTYSHSFSGVAGTCTNYPNTATFTTSTTGTTGSSSQTAQVCVGVDLTVSKTANPTYTRTYLWSISKSATPQSQTILSGGTATFNYAVTVTEIGFTDSNWMVSGTITVANPNDWESITANVADAVNNGGSCTVTGGTNVVVAASSSVNLPYTCTYASAPSPSSGTNTATATWDSSAFFTPDGSASGTAAFGFTTPTTLVNQTVTVTDTLGGPFGPLTATDSTPFTSQTFQYSHGFPGVAGTCTNYPNTAKIDQTGQTAGASVTVCVTPPASATDTSFCTVNQFRLIYIQDSGSGYNLQASNPGQFYYNVFYISSSTTSAGTTFTATIPYPFVTQGANPIQVFENQPLPTCGSTVPGTNINSQFNITPTSITLSSYSPQNIGSTVTVTFTLTGTIPAGNLLWFAIHLNYGLKGLDFTKVSPGTGSCIGTNGPCAQSTTPSVLIDNPQSYTFSTSVFSQSTTINSVNFFNKDPGFAGVATDKNGSPIPNVAVTITLSGKTLATVYTDQNGVYMYQYKYTGSATTYSLTANYSGYTKTTSGTIKSNNLIISDFQFSNVVMLYGNLDPSTPALATFNPLLLAILTLAGILPYTYQRRKHNI